LEERALSAENLENASAFGSGGGVVAHDRDAMTDQDQHVVARISLGLAVLQLYLDASCDVDLSPVRLVASTLEC
jgi:hypothetical protein